MSAWHVVAAESPADSIALKARIRSYNYRRQQSVATLQLLQEKLLLFAILSP